MFYNKVLNPIINNIKTRCDNPVLVTDKATYYYRDFGHVVSAIRHQLHNLELPNKVVGLVINNDIESYASILSIWLEGYCYVPLNPKWPLQRCLDIISTCNIKCILDSSKETRYDSTVVIKSNYEYYESQSSDLEITDAHDDDNAYILFTSGSTGSPKGVQITRKNVAAFIDSMENIGLHVTEKDKCLQPFDLSFDFSVSGYLIPLINGASIYTVDTKKSKITSIAKLLMNENLTILQMVPSMMRNMIPYIEELNLSTIRYNIFCGEALSAQMIKKWHSANSNMISYNMYGPTENTVFCTYYRIDSTNINDIKQVNDIVSIGKSFVNNDVLIIDNDNNEIIDGGDMAGELCLSGLQLTFGYLMNEKENNEKFFIRNNTRWYRTGDLCYYTDGDNLMYVSRLDSQVKLNGFRVELGEIESKYSNISGGRYAIIIPYIDSNDNTLLALIVESEEYDYQKDLEELRKVLPPYEIPHSVFFIRSMPLNQNGKVDRVKIKKLFNLK